MLALGLKQGETVVLHNTKDSTVIRVTPTPNETRKNFHVYFDAPKHILISREKNTGKD